MTEREQEDQLAAAIGIAKQWSALPPEHLRIAINALEPQLAREHEYRLEQLRTRERISRRQHVQYMAGLISTLVIAGGLLVGAIAVGLQGGKFLALALASPSIVSIFLIAVLIRNRAGQPLDRPKEKPSAEGTDEISEHPQ
jgi:hypothetical protein